MTQFHIALIAAFVIGLGLLFHAHRSQRASFGVVGSAIAIVVMLIVIFAYAPARM